MSSSPAPRLAHFRVLRPKHSIAQADSFAWLARAHAVAEHTSSLTRGDAPDSPHAPASAPAPFDTDAFERRIARALSRFGCPADRIAHRGHAIDDCTHRDFAKMALYDVTRDPHGADMATRTAFFSAVAEDHFRRLYAEDEQPPGEIVHVTCTGYASPSAAQRLVDARGWGAATRVVHAYHMGCYASLPAVRIACGLSALSGTLGSARPAAGNPSLPVGPNPRVDIVHTELCSLHLDPTRHEPEQLVVQSLFGDGTVRYSVDPTAEHGFDVLALDEQLIPGTDACMSWIPSAFGMRMTLARDVPDRIAAALLPFLERLAARAGTTLPALRADGVFAVHPGGPKIVDRVAALVDLRAEQVAASVDVLRRFGNMSSATLPTVWSEIARDPAVPIGTLVASLAFGPGLTVCGGIFRKV